MKRNFSNQQQIVHAIIERIVAAERIGVWHADHIINVKQGRDYVEVQFSWTRYADHYGILYFAIGGVEHKEHDTECRPLNPIARGVEDVLTARHFGPNNEKSISDLILELVK